MLKFINGKRYDTDAATVVHEQRTHDRTEVLYRKRTGEYFLWDCDKEITPLSTAQAGKWAKQAKLAPDTYARLFSAAELEAEEKNVAFYVLLPESLHAALKNEAAKSFISMKDLTVKILSKHLGL